ncbi:MAG TPA: ATP-dependent DNA ligase [Rugosimonospora sp.]|nr:ATP-dependent DNA ligase [Rugosimonospora sp.]
MQLPVMPPVAPMLAKPVADIPPGQLYEPKWDGFRTLVFKDGADVYLQSRDGKPLARYFPEVVEAVLANFPERAVIDGEIVVADTARNVLDFEALQQRIHPAASRVRLLAEQTPASFVAFDLLAVGDEDLTGTPLQERRARLEEALAKAGPPVYVTPATRDLDLARRWFEQFEGAGLDGLIAKGLDLTYQPDKRVMSKIKHERTADCVVAGYRVHKSGEDAIGSLLLGLYTDDGRLASVGVVGAFPMATRRALFEEMQPLVTGFDGHPWDWAAHMQGERTPRRNEMSRWNNGKDLSFIPLRPERVLEVRYDYMEGDRFRHTTQFVRWRPDREPRSCTYAQLERPVSFRLADVLTGG